MAKNKIKVNSESCRYNVYIRATEFILKGLEIVQEVNTYIGTLLQHQQSGAIFNQHSHNLSQLNFTTLVYLLLRSE